MTDFNLRDRRILVAEDEYMIADEYCLGLENVGAIVVGMTATVEDTLSTIASEQAIDGVVLDVNLGGTTSYEVADRLMAGNIPFIFTTGYDASSIPSRFSHVPRCEKPASISKIVQAMSRATCL